MASESDTVPEPRDLAGVVPRGKFTTLGLGKSGPRTFEAAKGVARARIEQAGLDVVTRDTLLSQLESGGARIRLIGGRGTQFSRQVIREIEEVTGMKVSGSVNLTH